MLHAQPETLIAVLNKPRSCLPILPVLLFSASAFAYDIRICTDRGAIDVDIDEQRAPLHAANFERYMESGFYAGTVIHRVVRGSMVQGGSFDRSLERRAAGTPVANESGNGLSNIRGTIAASRATDPNSATSQFFFNLTDNSHLDGAPGVPGYTVFGRVTAGLDVLDRISALPTRQIGELEEVPQPLVEIRSIARIEPASRVGALPNPGLGSGPEEASQTALRSEFLAAMSRNDAAGILAAADAFRQNCLELEPAQQIAEAEAALSLGYLDRARYLLDAYLAEAGPRDPGLARARTLYAGLDQPAPVQTRDIDSLVRSCNRPVAPTIPDRRTARESTLAALEDAVRRYRDLGQRYLDCVEQRIRRGDLNETETVRLTRLHNDAVVEITAVSMRYNQAVRSFRASRGPGPLPDQGR